MPTASSRPLACAILCALLHSGTCNAGSATATLTVSVRILRPAAVVLRDDATVTITDSAGRTHVLDSDQRFRFSKDPTSVLREFFAPEGSAHPVQVEILY